MKDIQDLYKNPKYGLKGIKKFTKEILKKDKIEKLLLCMEGNQRFKRITKREKKKQYMTIDAWTPLEFIQIDIADVRHWKSQNNSNPNYLLICIDVYSRFIWCEGMKNKSDAPTAFQKIYNNIKTFINKYKYKFKFLTGDNEFRSNAFKTLSTKYNFKILFSNPYEKNKSILVERVIGTIKHMISKYIHLNNTIRYNDVLNDIIYNYNHTKHSSIGTEPYYSIHNKQRFRNVKKEYSREKRRLTFR